MYKGVCKICGNTFKACRKSQVFCSHKCFFAFRDGKPRKRGWHRPTFTKAHRDKLALANIGKTATEETKAKMRKSAKRGADNFNWNNGRCTYTGYVAVLSPGHPMANKRGYVMENRFVYSEYINRPLLTEEVVHHINGIKTDNRIENLMLFPNQREHLAFHQKNTKPKT